MTRTVRVLRRAQHDLAEIHRYIEREKPDAADRFLDRLLDTLDSLHDMPERGGVPRDARLASLGYRVLVVDEYLILYKIVRSHVRVYRVVHGRRRYQHLL